MKQAESKHAEIQKIVTALEYPGSNEKIDELNMQLQKYLENVREPLNLSFWQTVNLHYWSFNNLTMLLGLKFDVELGYDLKKLEEKVRAVQKLRLNNPSPKFPVKPSIPKIQTQLNSTNVEPNKDKIDDKLSVEFENRYSVSKIVGCACLAVLLAWFVSRGWSSSNSQ